MHALTEFNSGSDFSTLSKDDFTDPPDAKDIYALRYNKDHFTPGSGLYAEEPHIDLSQESEYAKQAPRSTRMPYRTEKARLVAEQREREREYERERERERERVDGGSDRPHFPNKNKVYTDIEQVAGERDYDLRVSPATRSPLNGHRAYPNVFPKPEDGDSIMRQPYFPFDGPREVDYDRSRRYESRQDVYEAKTTSAPGGVTQSEQYYQRYEGQGSRPQDNFRYETVSPATTVEPLHLTPVPGRSVCEHDDVIIWKHIPRHWPFVRGIHRWPVTNILTDILANGSTAFSWKLCG